MAELFRFATDPYFVWVYSVLVLCVFLWTLVRLYVAHRRLGRKLRAVVRRLNKVANPAAFWANFQYHDSAAYRNFPGPWLQYRTSLSVPVAQTTDDQQSAETVTSFAPSSQYINDSTILASHIPVSTYSAVPNILTGLGILGTFIGLAGGIGQATVGITSSDPGAVRSSLSVLLDGAALAFVTSIAGVSCSLAFLILLRRMIRKTSNTTRKWTTKLDSLVVLSSPAYLASQQLKEAKKATTTLQNFATDLAVAIGEQTGPHFNELITELRTLRQDRATDSGRVIQEALDRFVAALDHQVGDQFNALAETVTKLDASLAASARNLSETQEEISSAMKALIGHLTTEIRHTLVDATEDTLARVNSKLDAGTTALAQAGADAAKSISDSSAELRMTAERLGRATDRSEQMLVQMTRFAGDFDKLHTAVKNSAVTISGATAPLQRATATIQQSVSRSTDALKGAEALVQRLEASTRQFQLHEQALTSVWKQYQERFEDIDDSLGKVFEKLSESLASYSHQVTEFAKELDATAGTAIEKLASATAELSAAVEEMSDALHGREQE